MQTIEYIPGIHIGDRGEQFKTLIKTVLKNANIDKKYIDILLSKKSIRIYSDTFTSSSVDEKNNYEAYEFLGDLSGNKFIGWYFIKKFPILNCAQGVKVLARLKINYGAKKSFYQIAERLGFWNFITATKDIRQRNMKSLLEDSFEAFIGATEWIIDQCEEIDGNGSQIVNQIMKSVFDNMNISLKYEDLYDAKTRLKELFDMVQDEIGPLKYESLRDGLITNSVAILMTGGKYEIKPDGRVNKKKIIGGRKTIIGRGSAALKGDAEQKAAEQALETMAKRGITKEPPKIYKYFSKGKMIPEEKYTSEKIQKLMIEKKIEDINELTDTKKRTKYQMGYRSTLLVKFARERNLSGVKSVLEVGANPDIVDMDGMNAFDVLFIGKVDRKVVRPIFSLLLKKSNNKEIKEIVYNTYYSKYKSDYYISKKNKMTISKN